MCGGWGERGFLGTSCCKRNNCLHQTYIAFAIFVSALITPSPLPIIILCTKYDVFQDMERCVNPRGCRFPYSVATSIVTSAVWFVCSTKRRTLLQALRFINLCHGSTLLCVSQRDKQLVTHVREAGLHVPPASQSLLSLCLGCDLMPVLCACLVQFRNVLNHYVFGSEVKKIVQLNYAKPLMVPPGKAAQCPTCGGLLLFGCCGLPAVPAHCCCVGGGRVRTCDYFAALLGTLLAFVQPLTT